MKKVLVAGASGYIGRYVVREFKNRGYWVRALVRNPEKIKQDGPHGEPAIDQLADEIVTGEATKPETIASICDGIDIVFSSLGMTRPDFIHSSFDIDYQANMNLLDRALKAKVRKFIYISVFNADKMLDISNIQAHEQFVSELKKTAIDYAVVRPTGYFSDMGQFLNMAKNGFMIMLGEGDKRSNPIHGADLAGVCVDAAEGSEKEIDAGGPDVYSYREVADLAASVAGRSPFYAPLPLWLADGLASVTGFINRDVHDIALFAVAVSRMDSIAPRRGDHHLADYFRKLLADGSH